MKGGIGVEEPPEFSRVVGHDSGDAAPEGLLVLCLRVEHPHVDPDAPGPQVMEEPAWRRARVVIILRCCCDFDLYSLGRQVVLKVL